MAGNTLFVLPEQVPATLAEKAFHASTRSHGRTARLAMNCVLTDAGLCRIAIPTVYREEYLLPLKAVDQRPRSRSVRKGMTRIYDWTSRFEYNQPLHDVQEQLGRCNAFKEDLKNYRLIFPENSASTER